MPASQNDQGEYYFKGLPVGEQAYMIAVSYKNNQPYIDLINVVVGKSEVTELSMRPTTIEMLKYQLSQINYHSSIN